MKFSSRILCTFGALLLSAPTLTSAADASSYPTRPVEIVVPYPAGGATDVIARLVAEKLPQQWNRTVIVRNQPGAGTTLAAEQFSRTAPDGHTLYMTTAAHTISASLYTKLNYDPIKDFEPLTLSAIIPLVLVTTNDLPVSTLQELIDHAKQQPDGLSLASTGNGTPQHLTGELFKAQTGLNLLHVPYRGDAPMITDLIGGQVQMAFVTLSAALPHIQSGRLKAIAVAHQERIDALKDVPTMSESGMADFNAATWFGLFAPAGINTAVKQKIEQAVREAVATPDLTAKLQDMGAQVANSTSEDFKTFIAQETKNWAEGVRLSGARIE